jgi:phage-related protein
MDGNQKKRQIEWMGSSKRNLAGLPHEPKQQLTYGIYLAELGRRHPDAKKMTGINAEEIVCDYDTDTYRAVYTLEHDGWVYVLHCFRKKSKKGSRTPKPDIELIKGRLKDAEALHKKEGRDKTRTK